MFTCSRKDILAAGSVTSYQDERKIEARALAVDGEDAVATWEGFTQIQGMYRRLNYQL